MNLEIIKNIINEYKDKFILQGTQIGKYKKNKIIFNEINKKYINVFRNIPEIKFLIQNINNLEELNVFCYCGKKNKFIDINNGYHKYCSRKCIMNSEDFKKKSKETKKEKYGNPCYVNVEKIKETKLKKYGNANYSNREKAKKTCLKKYGVEWALQNEDVKIKSHNTKKKKYKDANYNNRYKSKQTKKQRYGDENYNNRAKYKKTCLLRYNVEWSLQNKDIREKIKHTMVTKYGKEYYSDREKAKKTMLKKYGVDSYAKTLGYKRKFDNQEWVKQIKKKEYYKKRENNSFNKSEKEEQIYQELIKRFGMKNIIRQYYSIDYPFPCDFYIKPLNLYVEYHGTWTHGGKPFKNSIEDMEKLKEWETKATEINFKGDTKDYYKNAIYVWSKLDPKKLKVFKDNKLNYKIFYNINQFYNWYTKIPIV